MQFASHLLKSLVFAPPASFGWRPRSATDSTVGKRSVTDVVSGPKPIAAQLRAGTNPNRPLEDTRLLAVEGGRMQDGIIADLVDHLRPGDLLVLNDAATLPASLIGVAKGEAIEMRLAAAVGQEAGGDQARIGDGPARDVAGDDFPSMFSGVLFGKGDWRDDTDTRPAPPRLLPGDVIMFRGGLSAEVVSVSAISPRLVDVVFDRKHDALADALYRAGTPVQYRHLDAALPLAAVQTPFAIRPWAMEMPSTGRPLSWDILDALDEKGVDHAFLTHAAGLSATGDVVLDGHLPLPERYSIPSKTVDAILATKQRGGRVIAVGTTVVRALESAATAARDEASGALMSPGTSVAKLRLSAETPLLVVDSILTGMHSPGESHFELLAAFASLVDLNAAHQHGVERDYLAHELGDLMLLHADKKTR